MIEKTLDYLIEIHQLQYVIYFGLFIIGVAVFRGIVIKVADKIMQIGGSKNAEH